MQDRANARRQTFRCKGADREAEGALRIVQEEDLMCSLSDDVRRRLRHCGKLVAKEPES